MMSSLPPDSGKGTDRNANEAEIAEYSKVWKDSSYDFTNYRANSSHLTPKEVRVSFNDEQPVRQRSNGSGRRSGSVRGEDVLLCSSNGAIKRKPSLNRSKSNKSRLMDQPEIDQKQSRSGIQGKGVRENEEDDNFEDEYLPDGYKIWRYNKWTLLQLISLILIVGALVCTLAVPHFRNKGLFDLEWWKWELMILVLISGRLVSAWAITVLVFFIERSFMLRKRVLYFVYGLKKSVQNCIWLALVLMAWMCIFNEKVEKTTYGQKVLPYVTKIWICLLVGTVFWLFKTLIIKVLASSFHVNKFFDRIQDSLFNQYVIETLSGPPVIEIQHEQEEKDRFISDFGAALPSQLIDNILKNGKGNEISMAAKSGKHDEAISMEHLRKLNQKNISAWNIQRMMNLVNTNVLSTLDEQLEDATGDEDEAVHITSENQAKIAAKKIFSNVAKPGSKHIFLEDLMRFMMEDEALKTIRLFDLDNETKGISRRSLKSWVVNVFRERRALALSLNDTKTSVDKLHQMLDVIVGIIIIVIWLLILKVATSHFFIFLSSQLVLVAFVFGNACKTTFEAIIFLFVMHPFDVGDRCEVDGIQMIVEEMNILTTIFLRYDNQKITYPNSVLSSKPIANYHRSPDMGDAVDFCVHVSTPTEKIAKMKERITSYIENKSEYWQPGPMIVLRDIEDMNRLNISIWLSHRMNFQEMGERWRRRALLVEEMIKIFKDIDIEFRMLPVDINVRNMPAMVSNRFPSTWTTCTN